MKSLIKVNLNTCSETWFKGHLHTVKSLIKGHTSIQWNLWLKDTSVQSETNQQCGISYHHWSWIALQNEISNPGNPLPCETSDQGEINTLNLQDLSLVNRAISWYQYYAILLYQPVVYSALTYFLVDFRQHSENDILLLNEHIWNSLWLGQLLPIRWVTRVAEIRKHSRILHDQRVCHIYTLTNFRYSHL